MKYVCVVPQAFIDQREKNVRNYNSNGRSIGQVRENCDMEFAEYSLSNMFATASRHKIHEAPEYDTDHPELGRCEFKSISVGGTVTVKEWCLQQEFDHYVIWKFVSKLPGALVAGDEVEFVVTETTPKAEFEKKLKPSKYGEKSWYAWCT